jgi:Ni/Fe-hydrogenase subunit HybB-like protein
MRMSPADPGTRLRLVLGYLVLAAIFIPGIYASWLRFSKGLGPVTNLSDAAPWGLWIWLNLSEISVCASGFMLCAMYFIFHVPRLKPVVRPAVLSTFLGYSLVAVTLLYDIGLPLRFWHPIIMWNHHSVMLEVTWCIILYLGILAAEMSIPVTEGLGWARMAGFLRKFCVLLALLGAVLSILHQSSLGALFLIVPEKLNPLWYSSWLPVLFLSSALVGGLGFIIMEVTLAERFLGHKLPSSLFPYLARLLLGALIIYFILLLADFSRSGKWSILGNNPGASAWWALEIMAGTLLPMALLFFRRIRESRTGIFLCAITAVAGVLLDRLNVTIIGFLIQSGASYFPTWQEFAIAIMIIALNVPLVAVASRRFPIFET